MCMLVVRNDHVMAYVDSAKRFTDVQTVNQIINKYGAVEPGVGLTFTFLTLYKRALSQENLLSGFLTMRHSNQSAQLQRQARKIKFHQ